MTAREFIDNDAPRCPECSAKSKPAILPAGVVSGACIPGTLTEYPHYNPALPVLPGQKPGEQIVKSRQHMREICAGAWGKEHKKDGQRWELNVL
jgi:hypothetical protein